MRSQLVVIHRPRSGEQGRDEVFSGLSEGWLLWETCIRRIAIGLRADLAVEPEFSQTSADQIFLGRAAYQFLLEIVCGLHSPVRGETEVHGQFRKIFEALSLQSPLFKVLQSVHLDARKVRTAHLRGLGSQSYGSLARRKLRGAKEIHMVGAGALGREILPWLAKLSLPVHVHVRNAEKHRDLETKFTSVQVRELEASPATDLDIQTLLLTAPVTAGYMADWLTPRAKNLQMVLDYRGESHSDPLRFVPSYFSLQDIFREIESTKQKVDADVELARTMIRELCE